MADEALAVEPAGLAVAAQQLAAQAAALCAPAIAGESTGERSGLAAAGLSHALDCYCCAVAQRLWEASAALARAAGGYAAMEADTAGALNIVAPSGYR